MIECMMYICCEVSAQTYRPSIPIYIMATMYLVLPEAYVGRVGHNLEAVEGIIEFALREICVTLEDQDRQNQLSSQLVTALDYLEDARAVMSASVRAPLYTKVNAPIVATEERVQKLLTDTMVIASDLMQAEAIAPGSD